MALFEMKFQPGVDKQDTSVGATDRWIDSDNVRWRYNLPEKVGGWSSLLDRHYLWSCKKTTLVCRYRW